MAQREFDGCESAHGDSDDGAIVAVGGGRKTSFHIGDEVVDHEVFVLVLRPRGGVHAVRGGAVWHYENQAS